MELLSARDFPPLRTRDSHSFHDGGEMTVDGRFKDNEIQLNHSNLTDIFMTLLWRQVVEIYDYPVMGCYDSTLHPQ